MSDDRIDELLSEALALGAVPAEATPGERAEVERLMQALPLLQASRAALETEAREAMPTARARFERHLASAHAAAIPAARPIVEQAKGRGFFGGILAMHRGMTAVGSAAAIGLIAVVALFLSQSAFQGVETASAQVLTPGDYVQVEGVVGETKDGLVTVHSEFGDFNFAVSEDTSFSNSDAPTDVTGVKPGAGVLIGGIVGRDRTIAANMVTLSGEKKGQPTRIKLRDVKDHRAELVGKVTVLTISPDGTQGRVHIDAGNGDRYVVRVDGHSAEELIQRFSTAIGARVEVGPASEAKPDTFRLRLQDEFPPRPQTPGVAPTGNLPPVRPGATTVPVAGPRFTGVRGLIVGREGSALSIQTPRGPIVAEVRKSSRILLGESGLTLESFLRGEAAIGHEVTISGGIDGATGHVIVDLAVVGPKRPQR